MAYTKTMLSSEEMKIIVVGLTGICKVDFILIMSEDLKKKGNTNKEPIQMLDNMYIIYATFQDTIENIVMLQGTNFKIWQHPLE